MDFGDSEDIEALRDLFIERDTTPEMAERWDREDRIEREMLLKLAELGVCGLTVPEEFGGMGRDVILTVVTIVELAKRSTALAGLYIMNACYGSLNIAMEGTPEQKQRLLPGAQAVRQADLHAAIHPPYARGGADKVAGRPADVDECGGQGAARSSKRGRYVHGQTIRL